MSKWIAEFELEDGDTIPEHMDLNYMGAKIDFHCRPMWIPASERLPEDLEPVNITWVNHNPESYYADIKDKPFTATGHYCNGRWWWYSVTCQDYLNEYGRCDVDAMDDDIEVIAWQPLPKPYKPTNSNCDSCKYQNEVDGSNCYECVKGIRDNYKADSEKE